MLIILIQTKCVSQAHLSQGQMETPSQLPDPHLLASASLQINDKQRRGTTSSACGSVTKHTGKAPPSALDACKASLVTAPKSPVQLVKYHVCSQDPFGETESRVYSSCLPKVS